MEQEMYEKKQAGKILSSQNHELQNTIMCLQQEHASTRLSIEKQAELKVDERYRSRDESIKTYFDSQITKLLMGSGEVDKCMMLGREISALQILNDKQKK
jgi:hypothetical protein